MADNRSPHRSHGVGPAESPAGNSDDGLCAALQAIPIPAAILRRIDGELLFVNSLLADVLQTPPEECVGKPIDKFYADADEKDPLHRRLRAEGRVKGAELRAVRGDGATVWFLVSLQPIAFRRQDCVLAGMIDVTQQHHVQERLRRMLDLSERERRWAALEIHDGIVQEITGALMYVEAAQLQLPEASSGVRDPLEKAARLLRHAVTEARAVLNGLRPPLLDDQGLVTAIENLVEELRFTSGQEIQLHCALDETRLEADHSITIYRIVQEALHNAWKHSASSQVDVQVDLVGDGIVIEISDRGIGFKPDQLAEGGHGLSGIRERAEAIGGRAHFISRPGEGATIRAVLPIRQSG